MHAVLIRSFAANFSDSTAESTSSFTRSGERTSINSANHHVRSGASGICRTNSGNAVRFAMVVVPNRFASANPSLIEAMKSAGESFDFSALMA